MKDHAPRPLLLVASLDFDEIINADKSTWTTAFSEIFKQNRTLLDELFKSCS